MSKIQLKYKKLHPDAVTPKYAHEDDACFDLTVVDDGIEVVKDGYYYREYDIGLALEIPSGHVGLLFPRSSARKYALSLANNVGVVDSGYRGAVKASFRLDGCASTLDNAGLPFSQYNKGEKVVQMMIVPIPQVELIEVQELSETTRGVSGHGSSGK